jgi:hypothetical protein
MSNRKLVAIPCKLAPGMFSTELVFAVTMANGETHHGIAPRHFCWNRQGRLVSENEVVHEADGLVAAKFVEDLGGGQTAIEVPDGEVIAVRDANIVPRPTQIKPPGLSTLTEPEPNVPV